MTEERAMTGEDIFDAMRQTLAADPVCAANWHGTLKACAEHEGVDAATANRLARRFMQHYFGVETQDQ